LRLSSSCLCLTREEGEEGQPRVELQPLGVEERGPKGPNATGEIPHSCHNGQRSSLSRARAQPAGARRRLPTSHTSLRNLAFLHIILVFASGSQNDSVRIRYAISKLGHQPRRAAPDSSRLTVLTTWTRYQQTALGPRPVREHRIYRPWRLPSPSAATATGFRSAALRSTPEPTPCRRDVRAERGSC
jgi:hypothetical protein